MISLIRPQLKHVSFAAFFLSIFFGTHLVGTQAVLAQVTPNELSRLSLEELLGVEIEDITGKKRWMLSYEFRFMDVANYQAGRQKLSFEEVLLSPGETRTNLNFPIVPTFIKQTAHAFSIGREISNAFSLNMSLPVVTQRTEHISSIADFEEFEIKTSGIGDIALVGLYKFHRSAASSASVGFGVSFPTGPINNIGDTPREGTGTLERLPYTMQIGSGTYDFLASLSFEQDVDNWAFGIKGHTTLRTGLNENAYRLGNNYGVELTAKFKGWSSIRPGLHLSLRTTEQITGRDEQLLMPNNAFPFGATIANPENYGGEKAKVGGNVRLCIRKSCGLNINLKAAVPIYQNLNGIQQRERFSFSTAINYSF